MFQVISSHRGFIHAVAAPGALAVYASPLVVVGHKFYQPVSRWLDTHRHKQPLVEEFEDENMMFGKGILSVYSTN